MHVIYNTAMPRGLGGIEIAAFYKAEHVIACYVRRRLSGQRRTGIGRIDSVRVWNDILPLKIVLRDCASMIDRSWRKDVRIWTRIWLYRLLVRTRRARW